MGCFNSPTPKQDKTLFYKPHYARSSTGLLLRPISLKKTDINKEYEFLEALGSGSFGEVKKAKHLLTNEYWAIKILYKKDYSAKEHKSFINEAIALANLDHPNVIQIYDVFEDDFYVYIVMELCNGGELFDKLKEAKKFSEGQTALIFR